MNEINTDDINSFHDESIPIRQETFLFPPVTPDQQISACSMMMYGITMDELMKSGKKNTRIEELWKFIIAVQRSELVHDQDVATTLIQLSGDVLDIADIDLISKQDKGLQTRYHRELGINKGPDAYIGKYRGEEDWTFMTQDELTKLLDTHASINQEASNLAAFDFKHTDQLVFPKPVGLKELRKIKNLWNEKVTSDDAKPSLWVVPFVLDKDVAGAFCLMYQSKNLILTPRSELPIQDVVRAYLQLGVGNIGGLSQERMSSKSSVPMSKESFDSEVLRIWNGLRNQLPQDEQPLLSLYLKKNYLKQFPTAEVSTPATEHFQREFGKDRGLGNVDLTITRSGVSANGIGLDLAKAWVNQESAPVFETPGWYFENSLINAPDNQVHAVSELTESQILLINCEPNAPQGDESSKYFDNRNRFMTEFIAHAQRNPDQHFAMVVDKTVDTEFYPEQQTEIWPSNLKLVETMSITKHQRGGRGYFYGLVMAHGIPFDEHQKRESLLRHRGEMTVNSWIAMPKVTRQEIINRQHHIAETVGTITSDLQSEAKSVGLILEPYSYYFFLYPESILTQEQQPSNPNDDPEGPVEKKAKELQRAIREKNTFDTLEYGDSFNLNNTRITVFGGLQVEGNLHEFRGVLRISPGAKGSVAELRQFTQEFIHGWSTEPTS